MARQPTRVWCSFIVFEGPSLLSTAMHCHKSSCVEQLACTSSKLTNTCSLTGYMKDKGKEKRWIKEGRGGNTSEREKTVEQEGKEQDWEKNKTRERNEGPEITLNP